MYIRGKVRMDNTRAVKRGAWTYEEDKLLKACINKYGEGKWHLVPQRAGINECCLFYILCIWLIISLAEQLKIFDKLKFSVIQLSCKGEKISTLYLIFYGLLLLVHLVGKKMQNWQTQRR